MQQGPNYLYEIGILISYTSVKNLKKQQHKKYKYICTINTFFLTSMQKITICN